MKSALISALAAVILAVIAWSGTFLYWHIKIVGALRTAETQTTTAELQAAMDLLNEAGCRSLPYLVGSLDPRKPTHVLTFLTSQVAFMAGDPDEPLLVNVKVREHLGEWRIDKEDSPAMRQSKCDLVREWWRENCGRYHQTWRIWSSQCAGK